MNSREQKPLRYERARRQRPATPGHRQRLYDIIFEADTFAGRVFDVLLLVLIVASVTAVSIETLPSLKSDPAAMRRLTVFEWAVTILFAIEYSLRLYCSREPLRYAVSFWGVVDLMSFLPTVLVGLGHEGGRSFMILRSIRLLRVFRVLKLWRLMGEADALGRAVWQARNKIVVFIGVVMVAVTISGTLMYHVEYYEPVEGQSPPGFSSIPQSMYWAVVTMTTVGYGDVVPTSTAGKFISAALILLGYSLIIVPSGFVIAEVSAAQYLGSPRSGDRACRECGRQRHAADAIYCCRCGGKLET